MTQRAAMARLVHKQGVDMGYSVYDAVARASVEATGTAGVAASVALPENSRRVQITLQNQHPIDSLLFGFNSSPAFVLRAGETLIYDAPPLDALYVKRSDANDIDYVVLESAR